MGELFKGCVLDWQPCGWSDAGVIEYRAGVLPMTGGYSICFSACCSKWFRRPISACVEPERYFDTPGDAARDSEKIARKEIEYHARRFGLLPKEGGSA